MSTLTFATAHTKDAAKTCVGMGSSSHDLSLLGDVRISHRISSLEAGWKLVSCFIRYLRARNTFWWGNNWKRFKNLCGLINEEGAKHGTQPLNRRTFWDAFRLNSIQDFVKRTPLRSPNFLNYFIIIEWPGLRHYPRYYTDEFAELRHPPPTYIPHGDNSWDNLPLTKGVLGSVENKGQVHVAWVRPTLYSKWSS